MSRLVRIIRQIYAVTALFCADIQGINCDAFAVYRKLVAVFIVEGGGIRACIPELKLSVRKLSLCFQRIDGGGVCRSCLRLPNSLKYIFPAAVRRHAVPVQIVPFKPRVRTRSVCHLCAFIRRGICGGRGEKQRRDCRNRQRRRQYCRPLIYDWQDDMLYLE